MISGIVTPGLQRRAHAQQGPSPAQQVFEFRKIAEGVYHAVGTGRMAVISNAVVVVNDDDVLIVDSNVSPAAAAALLSELRRITQKPVRYVVNTHFHFDHSHGNQAYPPQVEIIGHEFTREMIANGKSKGGAAYEVIVGSIPRRVEGLKRDIDSTSDPGKRAELERQLTVQQDLLRATDSVRPTAPDITFQTRMTLHRGKREIRLIFPGRGHTGGDVVVYLPQEKVLVTGDLLLEVLPYMGDSFPADWVDALARLKDLDFDIVLPGHGAAFRGKEKIEHLQAYLRDFWERASQLYARGVPAEEAARQIDMRDHAAAYPSIRTQGVSMVSMRRAYELLGARTGKP